MELYAQLFDLFLVLAGFYMLYGAFTRKGSLFKTENVKKGMEEKYRNFMRWFCLYGGILAVAAGAFDYLKIKPWALVLFVGFTVYLVAGAAVMVRFNGPRRS